MARLRTAEAPSRRVRLTFCTLCRFRTCAWTQFPDGAGYGAFPHDTDEYRAVARRLGYADTMDYPNWRPVLQPEPQAWLE